MEHKEVKTYSYHSGTFEGCSSKQGASSESTSSLSLKMQGEESEVFGGSECGAPFSAQHLVVDFAPDERIDNDITQKKCCDLWQLIRSHRELKRLMALPDVDMYTSLKKSESEMMSWSMQSGRPGAPSERRQKEPSEERPKEPGERRSGEPSERRPGELREGRPCEGKGHMRQHEQRNTAVSMLECVENKGLIDRIFEAKLSNKNCSHGSREYFFDEKNVKASENKRKKSDIYEWCDVEGPTSGRTSSRHGTGDKVATCVPHGHVHALCHELALWDQIHPKNFSPPEVSSDFYKLDM